MIEDECCACFGDEAFARITDCACNCHVAFNYNDGYPTEEEIFEEEKYEPEDYDYDYGEEYRDLD